MSQVLPVNQRPVIVKIGTINKVFVNEQWVWQALDWEMIVPFGMEIPPQLGRDANGDAILYGWPVAELREMSIRRKEWGG